MIILRGRLYPFPVPLWGGSTQTEWAGVGSGLQKMTWGRNGERQGRCLRSNGTNVLGSGHPGSDEITGGSRVTETVCHHWPGTVAWSMDWAAWLKPLSQAMSLKLGMEAAETTCDENGRNHHPRTKSGYYYQKKKKGCLLGNKIEKYLVYLCWARNLPSYNFQTSVGMLPLKRI